MIPEQLKKYFWDTDPDALSVPRHQRYILERILEMGDEKAIAWMRENFSKEDILHVLKNSNRISKQSSNFWNLVLKK